VQLSPVLYSREGTVDKVVRRIHELGQQGVQFAPHRTGRVVKRELDLGSRSSATAEIVTTYPPLPSAYGRNDSLLYPTELRRLATSRGV